MTSERWQMTWVQIVGGVAVLGSYAWSIATHDNPNAAWGGIPESAKPVYTVSMFAAAAGYLTFTFYFFFRVDPSRATVGGRPAFPVFTLLYVAALAASALWMPLTLEMVDRPNDALWLAIRIVLAVTGIASIGLIWAIYVVEPRGSNAWRWAAVIGAVAFTWQTAVLDAAVWPAYFSS